MKSSTDQRLTVSVVIPTYNRANYLRDAIDSALNQTRLPDEIVVVTMVRRTTRTRAR